MKGAGKEVTDMSADPAWKRLYWIGGLSLVAMAIVYVIDLPLFYFAGGAAGPEEGLETIAEQRLLFQIHGVLLLAFLLLIPGILAIYIVLKDVNASTMLIATAVGLVASIQVGWIAPLVLSEVVLSDGYMAATSETLRNTYVVVAALIRGALSAAYLMRFSLLFLYMLLVGLVMRRGVFGRGIAYLSILGGLIGLLGILAAILIAGLVGADLSLASLETSPMVLVLGAVSFVPITIVPPIWSFATGYQLYRLGKQAS
jgi:hypothetical protein